MPKKKKRSLRNQLRNPIAKDLRTPKYKKRVVPDKKKHAFLDGDEDEGSSMEEKKEATLYGIACTIEFLYDQLKERGFTRTIKQVEAVNQMFNTEMQLMSIARRSKATQ